MLTLQRQLIHLIPKPKLLCLDFMVLLDRGKYLLSHLLLVQSIEFLLLLVLLYLGFF